MKNGKNCFFEHTHFHAAAARRRPPAAGHGRRAGAVHALPLVPALPAPSTQRRPLPMARKAAAALLCLAAAAAAPLSAAVEPTNARSEGIIPAHLLPLDSATSVRQPEIVRSFDDVRGQPYSVSYDNRSLLLGKKRVLLLGGSFHYPRAPPDEWRGIMQAMKADGLNHLQMYTFWNLHEQTRGVYDFSDASRANITRLLATAAEVGLFVNVRLGPYVCAEWNFGGLPVWLRDLPGVVFRDNNAVWKHEMATWVRRVTEEIRPFLARNGGPVIMVQIENGASPLPSRPE